MPAAKLTKPGPALFPETVKVKGQVSETSEGAYTVDLSPSPQTTLGSLKSAWSF